MTNTIIRVTPTPARFVATEVSIAILANALANIASAFLIFGDQATAPVWGTGGLLFDLLMTILLTGLLLTLIVTPFTHRRIAAGRAPILDARHLGPLAHRLPDHLATRATVVGVLWVVVLLPPLAALLVLVSDGSVPFPGLLALKMAIGALLGGSMAAVVVPRALADSAMQTTRPTAP